MLFVSYKNYVVLTLFAVFDILHFLNICKFHCEILKWNNGHIKKAKYQKLQKNLEPHNFSKIF